MLMEKDDPILNSGFQRSGKHVQRALTCTPGAERPGKQALDDWRCNINGDDSGRD